MHQPDRFHVANKSINMLIKLTITNGRVIIILGMYFMRKPYWFKRPTHYFSAISSEQYSMHPMLYVTVVVQ